MVRAVLEAAERQELALACLLRVSGTLGTRRSETLALRWSDIGDDHIVIDRALTQCPTGVASR